MNIGNIVVLALLALILVFALRTIFKSNKRGCAGNCAFCSGSCACRVEKRQ